MAVLNKDAMRRIAVIAGSYLERRNALVRKQESEATVEALRARLAQAEQNMEASRDALTAAEQSYDEGVSSLIAEHPDATAETINDTAEKLALNMVAMGLGELYEPGEGAEDAVKVAEAPAPRRKRRSKKEMAAAAENQAPTETAPANFDGDATPQEPEAGVASPQEIQVDDPVNPLATPDAGGSITTVEDPPEENWVENGVATAVASVQEEQGDTTSEDGGEIVSEEIPFDAPSTPAEEPVTQEAPSEPEAENAEAPEANVPVQAASRPVIRPVLRRPMAPRAL